MPVPWVLATRAGCTQRISSAGVNPLDRNASTVQTRFQTATRSAPSIISAGMPQTAGSNPVGICPPTVRESFIRRGTRISVPALRVTRPVAVQAFDGDDRALGVGVVHRPGLGLAAHAEREVLVEVDRRQQRRRVVPHRAVVAVGADAAALDDGVVVALVDLGLVDRVAALGVVPAADVLVPGHQAGAPGQLEDAGRGELLVDLHLEPGAGRAVGAELAGAHDDDHVLGTGRDLAPGSGASAAGSWAGDGASAATAGASSTRLGDRDAPPRRRAP